MPPRKRKLANFMNRASHMNEVRKSRKISQEHEVAITETNKQDGFRANVTLEDLENSLQSLSNCFEGLPKPPAYEGLSHTLTVDENPNSDNSNDQSQVEKSLPERNGSNDSDSASQISAHNSVDTLTCDQNIGTINDNDEIKIYTTTESEERPKFAVEGRRVIDVSYFYSKLQEVSNHGNMDCGLNCVEIVGEKQTGLLSLFTLQCKMCNEKFHVHSDAPGDTMTINHCAVAGSIAVGNGHSQLQELSAALNLPVMTPKVYKTCHCKLQNHWEKISVESMNQAAARERELAFAENRVDKDGIPIIDVILDGCWCKRTYKKNYSALSGAAAIIGKRTGEVLYLGVKNKYCSICAQAEKKKQEPKTHTCYKNYSGPSTGMESDILVEGFKCSIDMHNLIYGRMVSDGDASTYSKLLINRPYPHITVEKIECRNHILRNLCNKLASLQTETKYLCRFRKILTTKRIMILRRTIRKIIRTHKAESESEKRCNIEPLYNDIMLAHNHAFDDHTRCKRSFCDSVGTAEASNVEKDFYSSTLWSRICLIMSNVAAHAPSLIHDIDSNMVERYNSIVAKLVGGKRINFSKRGSYQARCHAAVVSFNTHKVLSTVYKSISGRSPRGSVRKLEDRRIKRMKLLRRFERKKNRVLLAKAGDENYGENCNKPDKPTEIFEMEKQTFLLNLKKSKEERQKIEQDTILQSSCSDWLELRRSLLTASNFGRVVKRRNNVSCANLVKDILYKDTVSHVAAIKHGRENERRALQQLQRQENVQIKPCGLFIDETFQYLGATPDGLIGEDTIVEIKCPLSAFNKSVTEAVENKKIPFYKVDKKGDLAINKMHAWYFQIQGQLHITKRSKCLFAIWTGEDRPLWTESVYRDDIFWENQMKEKLCIFYTECLLPELVDPRLPRKQKIRDPKFIEEAISEKLNKENVTKANKIIKRKRVETLERGSDQTDTCDISKQKRQKTDNKKNIIQQNTAAESQNKQLLTSEDGRIHEAVESCVRNLQFDEF